MNDKKENLKSALDHTRKAMIEIDTAATAMIHDHKSYSNEFDALNSAYKTLQLAEQKLIRLKD